jgi:chromosome segregation ATPase
MYKLRESLLAEAKDSPELKAEAELLEMQMAEKELDAKYAEELKSEKRKSIKYESILSEPSQ